MGTLPIMATTQAQSTIKGEVTTLHRKTQKISSLGFNSTPALILGKSRNRMAKEFIKKDETIIRIIIRNLKYTIHKSIMAMVVIDHTIKLGLTTPEAIRMLHMAVVIVIPCTTFSIYIRKIVTICTANREME